MNLFTCWRVIQHFTVHLQCCHQLVWLSWYFCFFYFSQLAEIMELPRTDIELSQACLLDYYVSGFWWAKEQGFTAQQISGFFTLLHKLVQNIKGKNKCFWYTNVSRKQMTWDGILCNTRQQLCGLYNYFLRSQTFCLGKRWSKHLKMN